MKNNKGFTLIELLAVLVILITIMMIAIPTITSSIKRSQKKQTDAKKELAMSAAEVYISDNKNNLVATTPCYVYLDTLIAKNYLTQKEIKDPLNEDNILIGCIKYTTGTYSFVDTCPINTSCVVGG